MISILVMIITIAFTIFSAWIDAEHYKKKQWVQSHVSRWLQRAMFVAVICVYDWQLAFASGLMFFVKFNPVINIFMQKSDLFYLGDTAKMDIFFKENKWLYWIVLLASYLTSAAIFLNKV